ncbi:hypothetical protein [Streptomyces sp. MMG1121]|uniref:hypothetical protein n=1 Tax=Streptomyces sp. MMG1121 TaxID=1415544 RepID=UPI00131C40D7|nr:hypothetical protein [Streptomyces sp. MMG1121]
MSIVPRGLEPNDDPPWCSASAVVDGRCVVKSAWARPAALRVCHQAQIQDALRTAAPPLPLPPVVAVSRDPAMLVLRWVPATRSVARGVRRAGPAARMRWATEIPAFFA